ncbi:MAG: DUF1445 domain-containing protein, partial [Planctomycetes bacterium]|nr:DUF1445 domain-containing protein [Planctomycetota bacterium]
FTFEFALLAAGVPIRHIEEGRNVPMYKSNMPCTPVGRYRTEMIVSMRPMTPEQAETAARVTASFSRVHGAPVHMGDAKAIGINVTAKGGLDVNLYFDKKTHLLVKQQYQTKDETGKEVSQEAYLTGYKKFKGISYPVNVRIDRDSKKFLTSETTDVQLKETIPESIFQKP